MLVFPNAKINLGLNVKGKRNDGYHEIHSVFYPIPFYDALEVLINNEGADRYFFTGLEIPGTNENNLVTKAIGLLRKKFSIPYLDIHLHKVIPMGAGLGGGSADGSFALSLLNELLRLQLSNNELKTYSLELGSDCPFFIDNTPVEVSGRGELMRPISLNLAGYFLVLLLPRIHVGTKEAYAHVEIDAEKSNPAEVVMKQEVSEWDGHLSNAFEPYVLSKYPDLALAKESLLRSGAVYTSMTGSGSTFYGLFEHQPDLTHLEMPYKVFEL